MTYYEGIVGDSELESDRRFHISTIDLAKTLGVSRQALFAKIAPKAGGKPVVSDKKRVTSISNSITRKIMEERGYKYQKRAIAFHVLKGGVGKTSLSKNFGVRAASYGYKVAFIDLDHQANLTDSLGMYSDDNKLMIDYICGDVKNPRDLVLRVGEGISLIPSGGRDSMLTVQIQSKQRNVSQVFSEVINDLWKDHDIIIIDCPPAIGSHITATYLVVDKVIAPINPDKFCYSAIKLMRNTVEFLEQDYKKKVEINVLVNRLDTRLKSSSEYFSSIVQSCRDILIPYVIKSSGDFQSCINAEKHLWELPRGSSAAEEVDIFVRHELGISIGGTK